MSETNKAVFLSYASQDAEAARRVSEALQAAGVEVWFDRSELRGGDAWDQKIRKQIRECALFVPIVSANTQQRAEGYFRLEWKLAHDRTELMARGKPFLLPVCIDETKDWDAIVPDSFTTVQWTRLPAGETDAAFPARVKALLAGAETALPPGAPPLRGSTRVPRRVPAWAWIAGAGTVGAVAFMIIALRPRPQVEPEAALPSRSAATPVAAVVPPTFEVDAILKRIWDIYEIQADATPAEWALAAELGAQAVKLAPSNAEAWAARAIATWGNYFFSGRPNQGLREVLEQAERATTLDPKSRLARLALANAQRLTEETRTTAEHTLRQLVQEDPTDRRALRLLAYTILTARGPSAANDEALRLLDQAAALPGGDASALVGKASILTNIVGRFEDARAVYGEAVRVRNGPTAFTGFLVHELLLGGDLPRVYAEMQRAPPSFWSSDPQLAVAAWVARCAKDDRRALEWAQRLRARFEESATFIGPRGAWTGLAHEVGGRSQLAAVEWRAALGAVRQQLERDGNNPTLLYWQAWLLAALEDKPAARAALEHYRAVLSARDGRPRPMDSVSIVWSVSVTGPDEAQVFLRLGEHDVVLNALEKDAKDFAGRGRQGTELARIRFNRLRFERHWDPLRADPRFVAVMEKFEAIAKAGFGAER